MRQEVGAAGVACGLLDGRHDAIHEIAYINQAEPPFAARDLERHSPRNRLPKRKYSGIP